MDDSALANLGARGLGLRRHEGFGDLAPPPELRAGKAERDAEELRLQRLEEQVAPLRRLQPHPTWPVLLGQMKAHAAGDPQAAGRLRRLGDWATAIPMRMSAVPWGSS